MLLGSPLLAEISRSGSASPVERNADRSCAECTTDLTRYGSRAGRCCRSLLMARIMDERFAQRNRSSVMRNDELPILRLTHLAKSFAGVRALRGVSFDLRGGEVHALVGENGAGKSTLIRIVTGAETPDSGTIEVAGRTVARMDPATARSLGIAAIYPHPVLFPGLPAAENIALPREEGRPWHRVDWRARRKRAAQLFEQIGAAIDPDRPVDALSMPERQLVEIVKAIDANGRILIMDEPTASLGDREIERLLDVVRRLRAGGTGVVYISHKLEEVFAVADRRTVLRDGESIATRQRNEVDARELVRLMVGREVSAAHARSAAAAGAPALELRGVSNLARRVRPVSLVVRRGEILGIAG